MKINTFDLIGAARRGGLRGLGQTNPNLQKQDLPVGGAASDVIQRSECPKCGGCHWIFYAGTAAGGIAVVALVLKALSGD